MSNFIENLQEYMAIKGINDNQMTVGAGLSVGLLGKAKSSGKGMSSVNIEKILYAYPDLSAEWLLRGEGPMLKPNGSTTIEHAGKQPPTDYKDKQKSPYTQEKPDNFSFETLLATVTKQAEEIGRLKARIEELERRRGDNVSDAATQNARVG